MSLSLHLFFYSHLLSYPFSHPVFWNLSLWGSLPVLACSECSMCEYVWDTARTPQCGTVDITGELYGLHSAAVWQCLELFGSLIVITAAGGSDAPSWWKKWFTEHFQECWVVSETVKKHIPDSAVSTLTICPSIDYLNRRCWSQSLLSVDTSRHTLDWLPVYHRADTYRPGRNY